MRLKKRWAFVMLLGIFPGWKARAQAAPTTYSYFYVAGQSSYTGVTPSTLTQPSTVNVSLYLEEANSDASSNSLLVNEDGLAGAGVSVTLFSSGGPNPTTITGISGNSGSPTSGFENVTDNSFTSTSAALQESLNFTDGDGVAAGAQVNGVSTVFLGILSLQASSTPGQTTTFTLGVYDPDNGNSVTFDSGYDLDNNADPLNPAGAGDLYSSAASTNFSITTALPEPTTALLLVVLALPLLRRPRRRASA